MNKFIEILRDITAYLFVGSMMALFHGNLKNLPGSFMWTGLRYILWPLTALCWGILLIHKFVAAFII
jgi:phage-related protein